MAWAAPLRWSASRARVSVKSSRRASRWRSDHALPGIFSSLPSSNRPTCRLAFRYTNRPSQAPAESRKFGRESGLSAPAPAAMIFSTTLPGAQSCQTWTPSISSAPRPAFLPKLQTHPVRLPTAGSGPGVSLFAIAYASVVCLLVAKLLLLIVCRNFARQIQRPEAVAVLPAKYLENDILAVLELGNRLAVVGNGSHRFTVDL